MLRITVLQQGATSTLKLEGKLAGPWVSELEHAWRALTSKERNVIVDVTAISVTDAPGATLLAKMREEEAELVGEIPPVAHMLQEEVPSEQPETKITDCRKERETGKRNENCLGKEE